jgi:choline-sulfatase
MSIKNKITRRDFLKLAGLLPLSVAAPKFVNHLHPIQQTRNLQNVIIVVFDALSAYNMPLYGYQRETAPNLARLAERAVVYHNHYAGGNFTAPGTASLLTGTLPWKHRALHHGGRVDELFLKKSLFTAFENYYRLTYTHNPMANGLLGQFKDSLDDFVPRSKLFLNDDSTIPTMLFENDDDIATVSWLRAMKSREEGFSYSLFFSHLLYAFEKHQSRKIANLQPQFPIGLPRVFTDSYYTLEDAIDWFGSTLGSLPTPFISYLHFMPPHAPYRTHREFYDRFENDGWIPTPKPLDLFSRDEDHGFERSLKKRKLYDEFILYVDREFGRFFDLLETSGLLKNTWVILTSDHGEMFERGINGHTTPVLYDPVVRIPLIIFEPGRKIRLDVHTPTSAVDVLPTLLYVTGQSPANWTEGIVLPPYSNAYPDADRSVYILEARKTEKYKPLTIATTALVKNEHKLMYFFGYDELGEEKRIELYDVENDPEELNNLYSVKRETAKEMLHELKTKLAEVDEPYL